MQGRVAARTGVHVGAVAPEKLGRLHAVADGREIKGRQAVHAGPGREDGLTREELAHLAGAAERGGGVAVQGRAKTEQHLEDGPVAHLRGGLDGGLLPGGDGVHELWMLFQDLAHASGIAVRVPDQVVDGGLVGSGAHGPILATSWKLGLDATRSPPPSQASFKPACSSQASTSSGQTRFTRSACVCPVG